MRLGFLLSLLFWVICFMVFQTACVSNAPVSKPAVKAAAPLPAPSPSASPSPTPIPQVSDSQITASKLKVTSIALSDQCAHTGHDVQGTPPSAYMKGIALSFARAACHPEKDSVKIASQPIGSDSADALAHYGYKISDPMVRLETTFAMLIGSSARESSWRWCVGKDPGASNTSADTCEGGLYQTSYNSHTASAALSVIYNGYKASDAGCFAAEYKGSTTCSSYNMKNWGTGEGVEFQNLSKNCPGFATEYAAVMFRVDRTHYGPLNRKTALVIPACVDMFEKIRQAVAGDPSICSSL